MANKTPWNTITNSVNQAYNITSNALQEAGEFLFPKPEPYVKVTKDDRDFSSISERTGIPMDQLVKVNNTKTLPPVGSVVLTQPIGPNSFQGGGGGFINTSEQNLKYQNSTAQFYADYYKQSSQTSASNPGGRGRGAGYEMLPVLQKQMMQNINPSVVPAGVLGALNLTHAEMIAEGYDLRNGTYYLRGSAADEEARGNNTGKAVMSDAEFLSGRRYYKGKYVTIGELVRRGLLDLKTGRTYDTGKKRNKKGKLVNKNKGGNRDVPQPTGPNFRNGPETILDIHLGSG